MRLSFFCKKWKKVFCFFGGLREISAVSALINLDNKRIKIEKYFYYFNDSEEGFGEDDFIKVLSRLIKKVSKKTPIIISFEHPFAKSSKVRLSVVRENPISPLEYGDLENIILNLAWRLYDKERIFVSQKMKISEWDVVLANSKISDPRIDDKKVLNPLGFTGKTLSFCLENTYLHSLFWEAIKSVLDQWGGELLFLGEKNLIFDKNFSLINKEEKSILVEIGYSLTGVGISGDYLNSYKHFEWGEKNLIMTISQNLSVSFNVAREIKTIYQNGQLSNYAKIWFKKLFDKELKLLTEGINLALKDFLFKEKQENIYLIGTLKNFPFLLETFQKYKWSNVLFKKPINVDYYDGDKFLKDLGITLENENRTISFNLLISLAYVFLSEPKYEEMNKILKNITKMKAENIYVENQESVSEVVERIINSKDENVILIIPSHAKINESILNFKLLKREAASANKKLFINSDDKDVMLMAKEAGIKLVDLVEISRPKVKSKVLIGDIKSPPRKKIKTTQTKEKEEKFFWEDFEKEANQKQRISIEKRDDFNEKKFFTDYFEKKELIDDDIKYLKREKVPIKRKKIPKLKISKGSKIFLVIIILFFISTFLFLYFLAKAEINITSEKIEWEKKLPVLAAANTAKIEESIYKIPLKFYSFSRVVTERFPATEDKIIESKAGGKIRIYNSYSSKPQTLIATTRFLSKEGKIFRLTKKVVVPGAKVEQGKIIPSFIDAEVIADKGGEEYNIGPTTFTIPSFEGSPKYDKFYAESFSAMTGGYIETARVVGESDFEKAKAKIIDIASISLNEELKNKITESSIVLDDAKNISIDEISVNPKVGEKAEQFEITAKILLKTLVFDENDIKQLFVKEAEKDGIQLNDKELFSYQFNYLVPRVDFDHQLLSFPVDVKLVFRKKINTDFKNNLTGKKVKELEDFFKKFNAIEKVDISIWPKFLKFTPLNPSHIKILIDNSSL